MMLSQRPPRLLAVLAAISLLEGLALTVYSVYDLVEAIRIGATGPAEVSNGPAIILQIVIFAIFGVGLLVVAWGWWGARRWARGPFILAQVFALVVGIPLAGAAGSVERTVGIVLSAIAIIGIVASLTPAVTRDINGDA